MKKTLKRMLPVAGLTLGVLLLFLLLAKPVVEEFFQEDRLVSFNGDTVVCAIAVDDKPLSRSAGGLIAGLNMDLIRRCSRIDSFEVRFVRPRKEESLVEGLESGRYDLLVAPEDSLTGTSFRRVPAAGEGVVWALAPHHRDKADSLENWLGGYMKTEDFTADSARFSCVRTPRKAVANGWKLSRISPYDDAIRAAARELGWDWRLLSALIFTESKFSITAESHRGAFGLMQIVPEDGDRDRLLDPYQSIEQGKNHLKRLQRLFRARGVESGPALQQITVAAYNAGEGRIIDLMTLADTLGYHPGLWENLATVIPLMATHADSIETVAIGRFRGGETLAYVDSVFTVYSFYQQLIR